MKLKWVSSVYAEFVLEMEGHFIDVEEREFEADLFGIF